MEEITRVIENGKEFWTLTPDEHDKFAARLRYAFETSYGHSVTPWGEVSEHEKRAWMNAVSALLFSLDANGKMNLSVVIDYD